MAWSQVARRDLLLTLLLCALARLASYWLMAAVDLHWWPRLEAAVRVGGLGVALIGLALEVFVWVLVAKLALEALHFARVERPGGEAATDIAPVADRHAVGQLLLWSSIVLLLYLVAMLLGTGWAFLLLLLSSLALPAAIVLAALDGGVLRALNPAAWRELASRIGADYLSLAIAFAAMALALVATAWLSASLLPGLLAAFVDRCLLLSFLLIAYARLGTVLREHRLDLALDTDAPIRRPGLASAEEDAAMREVDALVLQERAADAAACLEALIRRSGASAAVHDRYRGLLVATGDVASLSRHAAAYLCNLLALGQERRALALYLDARSRDPAFFPEGPDEVARLLAVAGSSGHGQAALDLARGLVERFPRHDAAPAAALAAARLLVDRFGREDEARALLLGARDRYAGHPAQPELARMLETLPPR